MDTRKLSQSGSQDLNDRGLPRWQNNKTPPEWCWLGPPSSLSPPPRPPCQAPPCRCIGCWSRLKSPTYYHLPTFDLETSSIVTNWTTITIYSSSPHIKVTSSSTIAALLSLSTRATFVLQRNPNFGSKFSRWDILTGFLCQEWHRVQARQDVLVCKINHSCLWEKFGLFQSLSPRSWAAQAAPAPWEMSLREPPTPFEAQEAQEAIIIKPMILARDF